MTNILDSYTNHTGGARGIDSFGCLCGLHYGFNNHNHYRAYDNTKIPPKLKAKGIQPVILDEFVMKQNRHRVNKLLGKNYQDNIMGNLQARNYHQVNNSDAIYCFSKITGDAKISGGTNTALQLAIELDVQAYVFDITSVNWFSYSWDRKVLEPCGEPILLPQYAIIGTRDVEDYKIKDKQGNWVSRPNYVGEEKEMAVKEVLKRLFENTLRKIEIKNN